MPKFYRNTITGQQGERRQVDGEDKIALPDGKLVEFHETTWIQGPERPPLLRMHAAEVAHEADRVLKKVLREGGPRDREWLSMTQKERIHFMDYGPTSEPGDIRQRLFEAIAEVLDESIAD